MIGPHSMAKVSGNNAFNEMNYERTGQQRSWLFQ